MILYVGDTHVRDVPRPRIPIVICEQIFRDGFLGKVSTGSIISLFIFFFHQEYWARLS